jgi:hypothetical protein
MGPLGNLKGKIGWILVAGGFATLTVLVITYPNLKHFHSIQDFLKFQCSTLCSFTMCFVGTMLILKKNVTLIRFLILIGASLVLSMFFW